MSLEAQIQNKEQIEGMEVNEHDKNSKYAPWTCTLILTVIGTTLGTAVTSGYCLGIVNSPALFVKDWSRSSILARYGVDLSESALNWVFSFIVSIFIIGGMIGAFTCSFLVKKIGRRNTIAFNGFLSLIAATGCYACVMLNSVELLLLSRFIVGLAAGQITVCLPMYHSEIATVSQRGSLGIFCSLGFTVGLIISQIISLQSILGDRDHWHLAFSFYSIFSIISMAPYRFYPESPKWLYMVKQRREEAFKELLRLRGKSQISNIKAEIAAMEKESNIDTKNMGNIDLLRNKRYDLPLFLLFTYQAGQQLSGVNAIFYYSVSIFQNAGLSSQASEWLNLGTGAVNLIAALMGLWFMANLKRRTMLLNSAFFCGVFILLFGILMTYMSEIPWLAHGCIVSIFLYIGAFQLGLGPLPGFIGTELFEVAQRPVALSLGNGLGWLANFLMGVTFPALLDTIGSWVFVFLAVNCFTVFFITKLYLPETKGSISAEIAERLSRGRKSKIRIQLISI